MYGCYKCDLAIQEWNLTNKGNGGPKCGNEKVVKEMARLGNLAVTKLGKHPDKNSKEYAQFWESHKGQWVCLIFHCCINEC